MPQLTDAQIDALIAADAADNPGDTLTLYQRIHERKRKIAHTAAKASQPALGIRGTASHDALMAELKTAWEGGLTEDEKSAAQGDIEYLLLTVEDCVTAGDVEDFIFSIARVARKLLGRNPGLWRKQDTAQAPAPPAPAKPQAPLTPIVLPKSAPAAPAPVKTALVFPAPPTPAPVPAPPTPAVK